MLYSRYRIASRLAFYWLLLREFLTFGFLRKGQTAELERVLGERVGEPVIALPQARIGFFLYLRAVLKPGDEVIMPAYTLIDMVNMVICAGGRPVFADVMNGHYHLCENDVRQKLTSRTRVVVMCHLYGIAAPITGIQNLCREKGLLLFEDCAQAFGVKIDGKMVGTIGDAGVYSFGALKHINGLFGGGLVIRDPALRAKIRAQLSSMPLMGFKRLLGKAGFCLAYDILTHPWVYSVFPRSIMRALDQNGHVDKDAVRKETLPVGQLCQMTSLQAVLIMDGLALWERRVEQVRELARRYSRSIADSPQHLAIPPAPDGVYNIYLQFPVVTCPNNRRLKEFLADRLVDINIDFFRDVSSLPCFEEFNSDCPNTELLLVSLALLPAYPRQDESYHLRVCGALQTVDAAIGLTAGTSEAGKLGPSSNI